MLGQRAPDPLLEPRHECKGEGLTEGSVGDDGGGRIEEGGGADTLGAVNDLGREGERARGDVLAEGADCGESEDGADAERFEGGYVGLGRDSRGRDGVSGSVAGDKGDEGTGGKAGYYDRGRRVSPGLLMRRLVGVLNDRESTCGQRVYIFTMYC
jgi:hypothetical protein